MTRKSVRAVSMQHYPSSRDGVLRQGRIPNVWSVVGSKEPTRMGSLTVMLDVYA